jgi:hypothetical protein
LSQAFPSLAPVALWCSAAPRMPSPIATPTLAGAPSGSNLAPQPALGIRPSCRLFVRRTNLDPRWSSRYRQDLLALLEEERVAGGYECWLDTDGKDIIKKFMFKHGFNRVADDEET